MSPTEVGWDGCPPCFKCIVCIEVEGNCCIDCLWDYTPRYTHPHDDTCPTCRCDGSTIGLDYYNQECNCDHDCGEEKA